MKQLLLLLTLTISLSAFAQRNSSNDRLLTKFSQEQLNKMETQQPQMIAYWNYFLDHGYAVNSGLNEKFKSEAVKKSFSEDVNLFNMDIMPTSKTQVFYDSSKDLTLVVWSSDLLNRKFNRNNQKK